MKGSIVYDFGYRFNFMKKLTSYIFYAMIIEFEEI